MTAREVIACAACVFTGVPISAWKHRTIASFSSSNGRRGPCSYEKFAGERGENILYDRPSRLCLRKQYGSFRTVGDDLTVAEAADALGTSAQTVRTLLRKGELRGRKQAWGTRYVWVPSRKGVDEFLAQHGRLDGRRRHRSGSVATLDEPAPEFEDTSEIVGVEPGLRASRAGAPLVVVPEHRPEEPAPPPWEFVAVDRPDARPFWLRPRGRALVVVATVGIPLLLLYAAARIRADALWFDEVGQADVFRRMMLARAELYIAVTATAAAVVAANLLVAVRRTGVMRSRPELVGLVAASLATGTLFAAFADPRWQTVALWRHRQSFGVVDPVFHRDIGFFVFTLPFELLVAQLLMWLVAVTAAYVAVVYWIRGRSACGRPGRRSRPRSTSRCSAASSAAGRRVAAPSRGVRGRARPALTGGRPVLRRRRVHRYHVRIPGLAAILVLAVGLAFGCMAAPFVARAGRRRPAALPGRRPAAVLVLAVLSVGALLPAARPAVRRRSESAAQRAPVPGAVDRGHQARASGSTRSTSSSTPRPAASAPPTSRRPPVRSGTCCCGIPGCSRPGCASSSPTRPTTSPEPARPRCRPGRRPPPARPWSSARELDLARSAEGGGWINRPARLHARARPDQILGHRHRSRPSTGPAGRRPRRTSAAHLLRRPSDRFAAQGRRGQR